MVTKEKIREKKYFYSTTLSPSSSFVSLRFQEIQQYKLQFFRIQYVSARVITTLANSKSTQKNALFTDITKTLYEHFISVTE